MNHTRGRGMLHILLFLLAFLLLEYGVEGNQTSQGLPSAVNTNDGMVYFILIFLFALNIATPIARCLYL